MKRRHGSVGIRAEQRSIPSLGSPLPCHPAVNNRAAALEPALEAGRIALTYRRYELHRRILY